MFIRYQNVRNTALALAASAVIGGTYYLSSPSTPPPVPQGLVQQDTANHTSAIYTPAVQQKRIEVPAIEPLKRSGSIAKITEVATVQDPGVLLQRAMKIANETALNVKGTDVLGASSPWKLNLYDDDSDGKWDRSKLDMNRDGNDDEKWNYKLGRWEKEGGALAWDGKAWQDAAKYQPIPSTSPTVTSTTEESLLIQYRETMKIALSRATKEKWQDALGSRSPWMLNLYDDDKDGQWDRAKLDRNRDDVDDEKWNFKKGRWEKDSGSLIWDGQAWLKP